jgi:hypothetical protein
MLLRYLQLLAPCFLLSAEVEEVRRALPAADATDEAEPSFALVVAYDSHYVFRGAEYGRHVMSADFSHGFSLSENWSGTLGTWMAVNPEGVNGSFSEIDVYGKLGRALGENSSVGLMATTYTYYDVPWAIEPEAGLYLEHSVGPVDLATYVIHDFEDDGDYAQLSASGAVGINDWLELQPSAVLAVNHRYFIEDAGWSHVGVSLAAEMRMSSCTSVRPYVSYNWALDAAEEQGLIQDLLFGGVSLSYEF